MQAGPLKQPRQLSADSMVVPVSFPCPRVHGVMDTPLGLPSPPPFLPKSHSWEWHSDVIEGRNGTGRGGQGGASWNAKLVALGRLIY